jgi:hypothetical protein
MNPHAFLKNTAKRLLADDSLKNHRRELCNSCPEMYVQGISNAKICGKCGCIVLTKTTILNAKCPLGKW